MNKETQIAMQFYHYMKVTRDLLEYAMKNTKCRVEDFNNRKSFFENSLKENALLNAVLKNNGENGAKVREHLEEFIDIVFNGTIIVANGETVRVDVAQRMTLLSQIVGIRETFFDIFNSHLKFIKEKGIECDVPLEDLMSAEDYLYRSLVLLILNDAMREAFIEFNRYLNENKGVSNPQSNFVANQIGTYISMIRFVSSRKAFDQPKYEDEVDAINKEIETIEGKLKVDNPKEREDIFIDCKAKCDRALDESERQWLNIYVPIIKENKQGKA